MTPTGRAVQLSLGTASAIGLARFAYGLLLPSMVIDLGWGLTRAGVMTTANGVGYLTGAAVAASAARRLGLGRAYQVGMALTALSLLLTATTDRYGLLLLTRAGAGVGGALVFVSGAVLAPSPVFFAGTGLGIVLSGAFLPALVTSYPDRWPWGWLALGAMASVAAAAAWTAAAGPGAAAAGARRPALRSLGWVAAAYAVFGAGYIAYITFLSAYLRDRQAGIAMTAAVWVVLGAAAMAAPFVWRRPVASWRAQVLLGSLLAAISASSLLALVSGHPAVVLLSAAVYGLSFMSVPAAVTALARARTGAAALPTALGALTVVFAAGQTVGPWAAGALSDRWSSEAALTWTAVLCAVAALLAVGRGRSSTGARAAVDH